MWLCLSRLVALLLTFQAELDQCCVFLECITQRTRSFTTNPVVCPVAPRATFFYLALSLAASFVVLLLTAQVQLCQRCVDRQGTTKYARSFNTDLVACKSSPVVLFCACHFVCVCVCVFGLWPCYSHSRFSSVSVVFILSTSPSPRAPSPPIPFPVLHCSVVLALLTFLVAHCTTPALSVWCLS